MRIATFYALLLLCVIGIVAIVLTFQLREILLDEARAKVDRVGDDISQTVRGNSLLSALGEGLPVVQQLAITGSLDHWAGPTTFVEVDTSSGYPISKSTNMGGASLEPASLGRSQPIEYRIESRPQLGDVLVRDEIIRAPNVALIVVVGESLGIYDETVARIRTLLLLVVAIAALVVVAASFAIASSAIEPINRLIAAMSKTRSDRMNERLGWSGRNDEIGTLAQSFDAMLDRLEEGFARERQFISDASHELKTPLTVINANAQMLERWADRDPEIRADSLRAIREESASLAAMVNGMLLLAKAESGDDIPRDNIVLERAIADAVRATLPRAEDKGLALISHVPEDAETHVFGDANLLRQLFTNLIDNAIKFTEQGSVEVESWVGDGRVLVTVSDSGIGIDEEAMERVFDRFFRADASRDRTIPGTGTRTRDRTQHRTRARRHGRRGTAFGGRNAFSRFAASHFRANPHPSFMKRRGHMRTIVDVLARAHRLHHVLILGIVAAGLAWASAPARADVNTVDVSAGPVVRINIAQGPVTIRTWDRESVQVDGDPAVITTRRPYRGNTAFGSLPVASAGKVDSDAFLPAESFVPGPMPPGPRDVVIVRGEGTAGTPVTVTIPNDAPLVFANAHAGALDVRGYRGGTLIGSTSYGRLSVEHSGGTAFLQSGRGPIVVTDSTFDRIRTRSLSGNIAYERCVVHQIETTAVAGSIVYDGGSFQPGLARFESQRGDVAIGSEAAAELSAHSGSGRVYASFLAPANVQGTGTETHATIDGGGPLVTAASDSGNVFLYDGSLKTRSMPPEWQGPTATLERPAMHNDAGTIRRPFFPERGVRRTPKFRSYQEPDYRR